MGLDMYLHKINKKANNEQELNEIIEKYEEGPTSKEMDVYNLLLENKPFEAIKRMYPWRDIELSEFAYNEEDGKLRYNNGQGIDILSYFEQCSDEIKEFYDKLIPFVSRYLKEEDKDSKYIVNDDLHYWRKHPDLHGHMEEIYVNRGGDDIFNCVRLILNKEDIEELIEKIRKQIAGEDVFETTEGFFFGATCEEYWKEDLELFEKVLKETNWDKETIYYSSWW